MTIKRGIAPTGSALNTLTNMQNARASDSEVESTVRRISDQVTFFKHVSDPTKYVLVIHRLVIDLSAAVSTSSYFRKLSAADKKPLADLMALKPTASTQEISGVVERVCVWLEETRKTLSSKIAAKEAELHTLKMELFRLASVLNDQPYNMNLAV
jgi:hypothetical protein